MNGPDKRTLSGKAKREKMIGKRYGNIVVLKDSGMHDRRRNALVKCKCDCGSIVYLVATDIRAGKIKSCGCMARGRPRLDDKQNKREKYLYAPRTECAFYRRIEKDCDALKELLCAKQGKCVFYMYTSAIGEVKRGFDIGRTREIEDEK